MEQYEDSELAYSLILESRLRHPATELFIYKFCSLSHLQEFLTQINNQQQRYVLTKHGKNGDKQFAPDSPMDLLLLVGSSKAS
ncbi:MAG TPA: hypothetical protein VGK74_07115 [Symbiobacteriaceae bacterium]|jgi:hypothetical protein